VKLFRIRCDEAEAGNDPVLPAAQLPKHGKSLIFISRLPEDRPAKDHDRVRSKDPAVFALLNDRLSFGFGEKPGIHERITGQGVFIDAACDGAKRNPDLPEKLLSSRRG
jgi:hypothetical protein